ncbi:unnamed protein product [Caenorhabditis bovis]|uniref:Uncharacterized protein n=1 Tax=Caenorhabditis bovis TaxID=2654633 RepID=A0A8S1EI50_9PELO|nr:unnamed protein product [Caenorhabditis bovis]
MMVLQTVMCKLLSIVLFAFLLDTCDNMRTEQQVIRLIYKSCEREKNFCPKQQYGIFENGKEWKWNHSSLYQLAKVDVLRKVKLRNNMFKVVLKSIFCCTHGPCLKNCRIGLHSNEIDLIQDFPANAPYLLKVELLKEHHQFIKQWLEDNAGGYETKENPSAELNELFDFMFLYQDAIRSKLKQNANSAVRN